MIDALSDVVGSLLRPEELLRVREQHETGELAPAAFKRVEDRAVDRCLRVQEDSGLEVVTDGEMRHASFQSQVTSALEGFASHDLADSVHNLAHELTGAAPETNAPYPHGFWAQRDVFATCPASRRENRYPRPYFSVASANSPPERRLQRSCEATRA